MFLIRFIFKLALFLVTLALILLICILGLVVWTAPKTMPKLIDEYLERKTGFSSTMEDFKLGLMAGRAEMKEITVYNSKNFSEKIFFTADTILIDSQPSTFLKKTAVFDEVLIDVVDLNVVRNASNAINVLEFGKSFKSSNKKASSKEPQEEELEGHELIEKHVDKKRDFLIKTLTVKIKNVNLYGLIPGSDVKKVNLNYAKTFTDVRDLKSVMNNIQNELKAIGVNLALQDLTNKVTKELINKTTDFTKNNIKPQIDKNIDKASKSVKKILAPLK